VNFDIKGTAWYYPLTSPQKFSNATTPSDPVGRGGVRVIFRKRVQGNEDFDDAVLQVRSRVRDP
jgi:hypothetical protein